MSEGSFGGQDSRPARESSARDAGNRRDAADTGRDSPAAPASETGYDTYDLYRRGLELLSRGSAAAAAQLLERAAAAEPHSRSVLEALARAQFDAGRYAAAARNFRRIVEASPTDDYAQFGLGLALARTGNPSAAAEHLALAAAMQPHLRHYTEALRSVRATLRARSQSQSPKPDDPERKSRGT